MKTTSALCLFFATIAIVYASAAKARCTRRNPFPGDSNPSWTIFQKCKAGRLDWFYPGMPPNESIDVTFKLARPRWACQRVCFKVPIGGASMTKKPDDEIVFNETFRTSLRLGSKGPMPEPKCLESSGDLWVAIHGNQDVNAYWWYTTFAVLPCAECERCQGEALVELYRRSSYAAIVKVTNVLRTDDVVKVSFTLNKYFSRGKGRGSITNDSMLVTTDTCNKMLRSGKKYGLLYSPSDDSQYTFCDVRRVRTVVRTIKPTKAPIQPTTEVSTAKATTESEVTTTSSTNLEATATATVVEENTTDPSSEFETTTTTTRIPSVVIETSG